MDKDLENHGAFSQGQKYSGYTRDLPDTDLSDHGALSRGQKYSGHTRDLPDTDLSDHGALSRGQKYSGHTRDLPDTDLSDHGALSYDPKIITWGTNDEEIVKQINILMQASFYNNIEDIVPILSAKSVAKIIDYRYRIVANILDSNKHSLNKDDKKRLGITMYMDLLLIDNLINLNPVCLEEIFNPTLYIGQKNTTNIFGVIKQYQEALDKLDIQIPLINGATEQPIVDTNGRNITAQNILEYLTTKNITLTQDNEKGMSL
jgi:hypothetical protein